MIAALLIALAVETATLTALIHEESRGTVDAVSARGACGILQVQPRALGLWLGRRWTCNDLKSPWIGLGAGLAMRWRWQERARRAREPRCWLAGYKSGNRAFRACGGKR